MIHHAEASKQQLLMISRNLAHAENTRRKIGETATVVQLVTRVLPLLDIPTRATQHRRSCWRAAASKPRERALGTMETPLDSEGRAQYPTGEPALFFNEQGGGFAYYRSGRPAAFVSCLSDYQHKTIARSHVLQPLMINIGIIQRHPRMGL